jgi:hypothetical protein
MANLKFHFPCFALCIIEVEEGEKPSAEMVGGFFASIEAAEQGADANELRLRGIHEQWCRKFPYQAAHTASGLMPARLHYEIVPLLNVEADSLDALQDMILQAACLRYVGVGKMAA